MTYNKEQYEDASNINWRIAIHELNELTTKYVELPKNRVSNNVNILMHESSLKIDYADTAIK